MKPEELGYDDHFEKSRIEQNLAGFEIGKISTEHKERYGVLTGKGEFEAEITGNMRFTAEGRLDYPAVGDWVALTIYDDLAIIHQILPRKSVLVRQAVGKFADMQVIAANIDFAFIVQSVDRDYNVNRLERYLTICYSGNVEPVIILSKTDLIGDTKLAGMLDKLKSRIADINVIPLSNQTLNGYDTLRTIFSKGKTYCFLGSSGVGKSTIINNLAGKELMKTNTISSSTRKGKHTTNRRELIILGNGAVIIDTPGLREVGIADASDGLENTFDHIIKLSNQCNFSNCTHTHEKGCAVLEAVESGLVSMASYRNYLKMEKERSHFNISIFEKRKKDKAFGKMCKVAMKYRQQKKF